MDHRLRTASVLMVLAAYSALGQEAQRQDPQAIEPAAMEALNKMGAYLRSLPTFQVNTEGSTELVLDNGMKVQQGRKAMLLAHPPNQLRAEVENEEGTRLIFYDGKSFTYFDRDEGYFATVPVSANLTKLADTVEDKYGIELPLVDLFMWGRPEVTPPKITAAVDLGPADIRGITCEHYAYRQDGLDWQLWIQLGDFPLPRRMVLTSTTDDARPQHEMTLNWNLAPSFNEAAFTFDPPPDTFRITFAVQN